MVNQGIAIAPAGATEADDLVYSTGEGGASGAQSVNPPLRLTSPASYTAYQLHPGLDAGSQQLEAGGYTADGRRWHSLRLVVDGEVLAEEENAARLSIWWPLVLGSHSVWLEGEPSAGSPTVRSNIAQVSVDPFTTGAVTLQTVD